MLLNSPGGRPYCLMASTTVSLAEGVGCAHGGATKYAPIDHEISKLRILFTKYHTRYPISEPFAKLAKRNADYACLYTQKQQIQEISSVVLTPQIDDRPLS